MAKTDLDALGLVAARTSTTVRFGPNDASPGLRGGGKISAAINQLPNAELNFDLSRTSTIPDYFAGLSVLIDYAGTKVPRFVGTVVQARADTDGGVEVSGKGAAGLAEGMLGGFTVRGVPTHELAYTLARTSGMREDQIQVPGLDTLARETFEVVVPVEGIEIRQAVDFAGVRFIEPETAKRILTGLEPAAELMARFDAPAYALALMTAQRVIHAEEAGLARIDLALAWLATRLRYGLAVLPDGRPLDFDRRTALTRVARRDVVAVRGLATTRQWLRVPGVLPEALTMDLAPDGARLLGQLPPLDQRDRYALLAFARAARESDPIARLLAIFESIEFYASGIETQPLFTDEERDRSTDAAIASCTDRQQRGRIKEVLGGLNQAPLGFRLKLALAEDDVPLTKGEMDLLWKKLRTLRNAIVHGKEVAVPETEDIDYATSMVARMLTYRAARLTSRAAAPGSPLEEQ